MKYYKSIALAFANSALLICMAGCIVYGPRAEQKSPLNALSGENYNTSAEPSGGLAIPLLRERERPTTIDGKVFIQNDGFNIPLKGIRLELWSLKDNLGEPSAVAQTESDGSFHLRGVVYNGRYKIMIHSDRYRGEQILEVNSYSITNFILRAKDIKSADQVK